MESATSVYMCFPCYQEFETLEEVLKHQLTCNAEATEPAPDVSGIASIAVQQTQVNGAAAPWESPRLVLVLSLSSVSHIGLECVWSQG